MYGEVLYVDISNVCDSTLTCQEDISGPGMMPVFVM